MALAIALPTVMLCVLGGYTLVNSRAAYEQRAELSTQDMAALLDASLTSEIGKVHAVLHAVTDYLEGDLRAGHIDKLRAAEFVRMQALHGNEINAINITDADGLAILGPAAERSPRISFADRAWFQRQRSNAHLDLYMSPPLRSYIDGSWIIPFSHRYNGPDGQFAGAISVSMRVDHLQALLATTHVSGHTTLVLRDANLGLIARFPRLENAPSKDIGDTHASAELQGLVASGVGQATYHARQNGAGFEATFSFRRLAVAPMLVVVGLGNVEFLQTWWTEVRGIGSVFAIAIVLYAGGCLLIGRMALQKLRNSQRLERLNAFYTFLHHTNNAIRTSQDPMAMLDTVCQRATGEGMFLLAWGGVPDPESGTVRAVCAHGEARGYAHYVHITLDPNLPSSQGPSGRCLQSRETIYTDDFQRESPTAYWKDLGVQYGFNSSAAVPIVVDGRAVACIGLYSAALGHFDPELRGLLAEMASNLALAWAAWESQQQRDNAQAGLKASEDRYRLLFQNNRDAIFQTDASGQVLSANDAACQMLQRSSAQLCTMNRRDFVDPADARIDDLVEQSKKLGRAQGNVRMLRDDGSLFEAEVSASVYTDLQGQRMISSVVRDVTESRRVERELRRLYVAVEQSPVSTVITNLAGDIEYVNLAFLHSTGYAASEVLGRNARFLQSGLTPMATYDAMWSKLTQGQDWSGLLINKRKDGSIFEEQALIAPVRQEDGTVTHYLGIKTDVTEARRTQRELELYRAHLEELVANRTAALANTTQALQLANDEQTAIFDAASSGVVLVHNGTMVRCNRRMAEIFAWPEGSLEGQELGVLFLDEASYALQAQALAELDHGARSQQLELQLRRRDASQFWARMTGSSIDRRDQSKGTVWVIDDVTPEHASREAMAQALRLANDAASTKANFLANMSHEIRTPLNAVIGMTYLTLNTELSAQQRNYLARIQHSGEHLLGLINDILDVSKIESGKLTLEQVEFDLEQELTHVGNLVVDMAGKKNLELLLDVAPDVPSHLLGDPLRLRQIIINFANNAVKFTEQGEITISVQVEEANESDVLLRIAVKDSGIGLTEAQRGQLFQAFQQADASTTRKYGGTGLGLAISQKLATLMHGEVGASGEPGKGSIFWLRARFPTGPSLRPRPQLPPPQHGQRVLVVDDHAGTRELLARQLGALGLACAQAASGTDGLQAVAQADAEGQPFALVFLDRTMPGMDGLASARALRQCALRKPPALILLVSGSHGDKDAQADALGIAACVAKPATARTLLQGVTAALGAALTPEGAAPSAATTQVPHAIAGARVLLVEDNAAHQELARDLLQQAGLLVEVAHNGAMAVAKVHAQAFDLVLMDLQLPVMDGLAAAREIRHFSTVPIVAMTAHVLAPDQQRCLDAGMNGTLAKPIHPDALLQALQRWLPAPPYAAQTGAASRMQDGHLPAFAIAGLDHVAGLQHVGGSRALYRSLLQRFVDGQRGRAQELQAALAANERQRLEHMARGLKSIAGSMGATRLQALAEALEQSASQETSPSDLKTRLEALVTAHTALLQALQSALPPLPAAPGASATTPSLQTVCERLDALLAYDDSDALDLWNSQRALLQAAFAEQFTDIEDAINRFDFETALRALRQARAPTPH